MTKKAILYEIVNIINSKRYIGVTTMTLKQRWCVHLYKLRHGIATEKLQLAFNEFGEKCFIINKIKIGNLESMLLCENELTKETVLNGYNTIIGGGGKEERFNSIQIFWDKIRSNPEYAQLYYKKLSNINKGKIVSDETKQKMSLSRKGKKWKEEHKANRSILYSGIGNPNAGNFSIYLNTQTGIYYNTPELLKFLGVGKDCLNKYIRYNNVKVNNFIKT